ncbi:short-chain dehydrogenase/reductase family 42E member 1-like [Branchiostoma floridae]|uniref:Short-chain dehydrogenase/reductase family 42E member 1-like n=1 Tax=Branchiostoma floridae TaxID=7739 RepID=A0A9J7NAV2_BRAFL|nr:short-chain dehydrogenase/reductase family 42E member 1-like [Branchiostoma floridae]
MPEERVLVTGGGGYLGLRLANMLQRDGANVTLFDLREPIEKAAADIKFIKGDITNYEDVEDACRGMDCVYHIASHGMSGREQLNRKLIEAVNVGGTKNVIKACCRQGVHRLVYTSTFNVVFGGQKIEFGDESLPYLPLHKHPDYYSMTKSIAEMEILKANGTVVEGGGTLHTCALRPAGIYGPGEQRHLPRIVSYIEQGLFAVVYGEPDSLVEFVHVDNLATAHVLAGRALQDDKQHVAAGQAYFISDGKPVNNFEFFRPLVEGLGYTYPTVRVPVSLVYFFAFLTEMVHYVVGRFYNFQPLLTRTEVYKTGVTHYFNLGKAKRELGYEPVTYDLSEVVQWFKIRGHGRAKGQSAKSKWTRLLVDAALVVMAMLVVMSFLPSAL